MGSDVVRVSGSQTNAGEGSFLHPACQVPYTCCPAYRPFRQDPAAEPKDPPLGDKQAVAQPLSAVYFLVQK